MLSACIDHGCKGYGLGYATAGLTINGRRFTTTKHRKVYYDATGTLPEVVRHKCDNPRCINIEHLEAGTHKDNYADMQERNRLGDPRNFGERNGRAVLSDLDVRELRVVYRISSKMYGFKALLAREYGIGSSQVQRILNGIRF